MGMRIAVAATLALCTVALPAAAQNRITIARQVDVYLGDVIDTDDPSKPFDPALGTLSSIGLSIVAYEVERYAGFGTAPRGDQPAVGSFRFGPVDVALLGVASPDGTDVPGDVRSTASATASITDAATLAAIAQSQFINLGYDLRPQNPDYASAQFLQPSGRAGLRATFVYGTPAVPEPAGWALTITGLGCAGAAVRRARTCAVA